MTIECAECGKEYDPDDLIDIGDKKFISVNVVMKMYGYRK